MYSGDEHYDDEVTSGIQGYTPRGAPGTTRQLVVNEVFGPTIQGEGTSAGHPAAFIRMAGCNLACVWCDSKHSWDWSQYDRDKEVTKYTPAEAAAQVLPHLPAAQVGGWPLLVVTGGEPMLQQAALLEMLFELPPIRVEVETAGTKAPHAAFNRKVSQYNVSLKLAHSGNAMDKRVVVPALEALSDTSKAVWKFVCQTRQDVDEAAELVQVLGLRGDVYVMPEGTSQELLTDRARLLAPVVIDHGWYLTPRLHIELWGKERGR